PPPRHLFPPLSEPAIALLPPPYEKFARPCPSPPKDAGAVHRTLPAKNRNFLDLWQTIAQDLSSLLAVPD
ncbi:hypothetical protein, partial [uncultured Desulfovibrio sp.]|uniref:hypothetical protein n=1 Tax=uncultured Desulfovibrio sp. TaxID=167968 RepID=UPI00265CF973